MSSLAYYIGETPISLVSTWFYYRDTLLQSKIAKILGNVEDHDRFLKRAEEIKISFNKKFLGDKNFYGWTEDWYRTYLPSNASIGTKKSHRKDYIGILEAKQLIFLLFIQK